MKPFFRPATRLTWLSTLFLIWGILGAPPACLAQEENAPSDEQKGEIESKLQKLAEALKTLSETIPPEADEFGDLLADVAVLHKAGDWILRHGEYFEPNSASWTMDALDLGLERAKQLAEGESSWRMAKGGTVLGYQSVIDGSVQPYAVYVPEDYDQEASNRVRLDVLLHGRNARLNEVRFVRDHQGREYPEEEQGIVLHVFGRTNNAYRWAGEMDVFEAIEAVRRNFLIDPARVVLRGFSMGGAGAWHLGLHHPSLWSSIEAGAGFSETVHYARLKDLNNLQRKLLRIYDAQDYALNAFNVPIAGYGGEEDPQLQASVNIKEALEELGFEMEPEGLLTRAKDIDALFVVGEKMGHRVDPTSAEILKEFRDERADRGRNPNPKQIRFETYTVKYNRAAWVRIEEMVEHYQRATVDAEIEGNKVVVSTENVAVLAVERQAGESIEIDGQPLPLEEAVEGLLPHVYYRLVGDRWSIMDYNESRAVQLNTRTRKHQGLQGPIDDAFTSSFLCVRGTGDPWNPRVQEWADARLDRFAKAWDKYLRGRIRIKDDADLTPADFRDHHLILFGDPGSNSVLAKLLSSLPLEWTEDTLALAGEFASKDHAPVLIVPNPVNPGRYLVLNSGHTFGEDAFKGTNALLYPRLGDYSVFQIGKDVQDEEVVVNGLFDDAWRLLPEAP